jgi:uncharacterized membrane protein
MSKEHPAYLFAAGCVLLVMGWLALVPCHNPVQAATPEPIARAILFTSPLCRFCREIIEDELPPVIERFGNQLQIVIVDITTPEGEALYLAAITAYDVPRGVPLIFLGPDVLGGVNIPEKIPMLVESALAQGGGGWPAIPGVEAYLAGSDDEGHGLGEATQAPAALPAASPAASTEPFLPAGTPTTLLADESGQAAAMQPPLPMVSLLLFWTPDCQACKVVVEKTIPALVVQYGAQLDVQYVDIVTSADVDRFYQVAGAYGVSKNDADLPLVIIGDRALIGAEQIPAELPGLIEKYLAGGGGPLPDVSRLVETSASAETALQDRPDGFWLAIGVLVFMVIALLYTLAAFYWQSTPSLPAHWMDIVLPVLSVIGLGVAVYLAYVETQSVRAACGPVGDCNAVQASPYARLFGVLPVGVLGVLGYLAILVAWGWYRLWRDRSQDRLADLAALAVFVMALFGVLFSIYLTYLEPFVIKAVCAWCVSSAILMTLLMLLALTPARRAVKRA